MHRESSHSYISLFFPHKDSHATSPKLYRPIESLWGPWQLLFPGSTSWNTAMKAASPRKPDVKIKLKVYSLYNPVWTCNKPYAERSRLSRCLLTCRSFLSNVVTGLSNVQKTNTSEAIRQTHSPQRLVSSVLHCHHV